jgi:hypothetical protein
MNPGASRYAFQCGRVATSRIDAAVAIAIASRRVVERYVDLLSATHETVSFGRFGKYLLQEFMPVGRVRLRGVGA